MTESELEEMVANAHLQEAWARSHRLWEDLKKFRRADFCSRWRRSFRSFVRDMGPMPPRTCLDLIDETGKIEPGNCRWIEDPCPRVRKMSALTKGLKVHDEDGEWLVFTGVGADGKEGPFETKDVGDMLTGLGPIASTLFMRFRGRTISNTTFLRGDPEDDFDEYMSTDMFAAECLLGIVDFW